MVQDGHAEEILLSPADEYVSNFVKDVNRIKVLKIKTILNKDGKSNESGPTVKINESIETCLPIILESHSDINVLDESNNFVGIVSKENVAAILRKS